MEIYFKTSRKADMQEVTPTITAIATQKITTLKKYLGKRKSIAKVYVELGKESGAHENGHIWRVQMNLDCDGRRFNAGAIAERPEAAFAASIRELEQELRKAKKRQEALLHKGGGLLKDFLRGFKTP